MIHQYKGDIFYFVATLIRLLLVHFRLMLVSVLDPIHQKKPVSFTICKRCLFECDMGKYSMCPVGALISNIAEKMNNVFIFSHKTLIHDIPVIHCPLTL